MATVSERQRVKLTLTISKQIFKYTVSIWQIRSNRNYDKEYTFVFNLFHLFFK